MTTTSFSSRSPRRKGACVEVREPVTDCADFANYKKLTRSSAKSLQLVKLEAVAREQFL